MNQLREDAVDRVGMQERDLEPEQPLPRLFVDELDSLLGKLADRRADVGNFVGDVVHPGPALAEELADRRLLPERGQQLDAAVTDPQRRGFDALVGNRLSVLEPSAEDAFVGRDRLIEIIDGDPEMVDPAGLHAGMLPTEVGR
jgi:hypothetical protein